MRETVAPSIARWSEGEVLDLKTEMGLMAQDVAMSVLCSFRAEQERARAILDAVDTVFTAAIWRTMVPVSSLERLPTRSNRRLKAARSLLRSEVADIIAERRANPGAHNDLVTLLLEARDESGAPLPDNEILSEIIGLLAAGSETTGVMLAWLFHELGRHPELERYCTRRSTPWSRRARSPPSTSPGSPSPADWSVRPCACTTPAGW